MYQNVSTSRDKKETVSSVNHPEIFEALDILSFFPFPEKGWNIGTFTYSLSLGPCEKVIVSASMLVQITI